MNILENMIKYHICLCGVTNATPEYFNVELKFCRMINNENIDHIFWNISVFSVDLKI